MLPRYYRTLMSLPMPFRLINVMETPPGYLLDFHTHECFHVNLICDGLLTITTPLGVLNAGAGQVFIMPPGVMHRLDSEQGYRQIGIDLFDGAEDDRELFAAFNESVSGAAVVKLPLSAGYDRMRCLLDDPSRRSRQIAVHIAESIILDTIDSLRDRETESFNAGFASIEAPWKLTLSEISARLGISRSCLERMAQKSFGCGLGEYCLRLRFSEVCRLLRTTDMKLDEIASELGFCDSSHLSVFFRQRAGCTPRQYKSPGDKK